VIEDFLMEFEEGPSFAKAMESFGKSIVIETKIYHVIQSVRIPRKETRLMLRTLELNEARRLDIHTYLIDTISKMGLGEYQLAAVSPYEFTYQALSCDICTLYPEATFGHVCHAAVDGLQLLFQKAMNLQCDVEELECTVAKDQHCVFQIRVQPLSGLRKAMDTVDMDLLSLIAAGEFTSERQTENLQVLGITQQQLDDRMRILREFRILGDDLSVSPIGKNCIKFCDSMFPKDDDDFPPPWEAEKRKKEEGSKSEDAFAKAFSLPFTK